MPLPDNNPQRFALNYELHARPFAELRPPTGASYLAMITDDMAKPAEQRCLAELCARYGHPPRSTTSAWTWRRFI